MKAEIHPDYPVSKITCACGNVIVTRSTKGDFTVDICNECHPFFTGKQRMMDTAGRIERFRRKYAKLNEAKQAEAEKADAAKDA